MSGRTLTLLLVTVVTVIAASGAASGQEARPGRWWKDPQICRDLGLNSREQAELDRLFERNRDDLMRMRSDLEEERSRLKDTMGGEPFDESRVKSQLKRVEDRQQRLTQERMKYLIEVRKILGPKRFRDLENKAPAWQDRRGRGQGHGRGWQRD
jgi:Spy/CpxP family protein refolding chaperone